MRVNKEQGLADTEDAGDQAHMHLLQQWHGHKVAFHDPKFSLKKLDKLIISGIEPESSPNHPHYYNI